MPRPLRLEYAGAMYHVMNRGDRREDIFKDDQDRERFLSTLAQDVSQNRMAGACMVPDEQSLSSGRGDAAAQLSRRHEVVAGCLHQTL